MSNWSVASDTSAASCPNIWRDTGGALCIWFRWRVKNSRCCRRPHLLLALISLSGFAHATITNLAVQSPMLSGSTSNVNSPVHFQATAETNLSITGYVVYVDDQIAFRNFNPSLDAWVVLAPGITHRVLITTWDASGA